MLLFSYLTDFKPDSDYALNTLKQADHNVIFSKLF